MTATAKPKREPPTPEQIRAIQQKDAEQDLAERKANLPAPLPPTTVALPDSRSLNRGCGPDISEFPAADF